MSSSGKDFAQGEQAVKARKVPLIGAGETGRELGGVWTPLLDWNEVFAGNRGVNRRGVYDLHDAPIGVRLEVEPADKSDPIILSDQPWEGPCGQIVPMAFWHDAGRYHMLYTVWDRRAMLDPNYVQDGGGGVRTCTCYATSVDGYTWEKPPMHQVEYEGSTANNMITHTLMGVPLADPTAPAQTRWRAVGQEGHSVDPDTGDVLDSAEAARRFKAMEHGGDDYAGPKVESRHWLTVWTSADGMHWEKAQEHAADRPSDGGNAAQYDADTGEYFAYMRVAGMGRRAIGLSRTRDFWQWPVPQLVLFPDPQDDADVSFYGANYFPYPGRKDLYGMLLQIFHQRTDTMDNQLAFSRDGVHWYRPERRAALGLGPAGSNEEGMVRAAQTGLHELPDGRWGALYEGVAMLHNAGGVIRQPSTQMCWARWQRDRFCGVAADCQGEFTIPTVRRTRGQLRLNYRCALGGWIQVELIRTIPSRLHPDADGMVGYTFAESDRLQGDELEGVVTWGGNADLEKAGAEFAIRLRMFQAKLFAYSI